MENESMHVMVLVNTHPTGAEEWFCPTCRRRMLLQWPPAFQSIVLEDGDITVQHSGSKGGIQVGGMQVTPKSEDEALNNDALQVWAEALADLDLDGLGVDSSGRG